MVKQLLITLLLATPTWASLANVYISSDASLSPNNANAGDSCVSGHPKTLTFFNTVRNWGAGAGQIGDNTVVHLCGTNSGADNATGLTFQAGGSSSGTPITLRFETGATLTSPGWANAIVINGKDNITIDGNNTTDSIQNTLNGSPGATCTGGACSVAHGSVGISLQNSFSGISILNIRISNIYVQSGSETAGSATSGISAGSGRQSNIVISNYTMHDARNAIFFAYGTLNGLDISYMTSYNTNCSVCVWDNNTESTAQNVKVHESIFHDWALWANSSCCHNDGVMFAATNGSTSFTSSSIYNNFMYGNMIAAATGFIYLTGSSGGMNGIRIYNNLLVNGNGIQEGLIVLGFGSLNTEIYNNTLASRATGGTGIKIRDSRGRGHFIENNIFYKLYANIELNSGNTIALSDYNDYYGYTHLFRNGSGGDYSKIPAWQTYCSCGEAHSLLTDPKLDALYHLQAGSGAIRLGSNLTSLGISALNADKPANIGAGGSGAGVARPADSNWDAGVYQFNSATLIGHRNGPDYPDGGKNGRNYGNGLTGADGSKH